ncbi:MAG: GNAT family N-acetyltransferase [Defluviitaleaceae bacterium]|nr:GNAT family N-acetyltransferase [Defluviitaleaceae bacterium]
MRIILTPLSENDFQELTPLITNEEVRKYLGGVRPVEDTLNGWRDCIKAENVYPFTIRLKNSNAAVGLVILAPHHNPEDMEVSFLLLPNQQGQGYAKEAVEVLHSFCKQELRLTHVVSETQTANTRSRRLLEKLGYKIKTETERFGEKQTIYHLEI